MTKNQPTKRASRLLPLATMAVVALMLGACAGTSSPPRGIAVPPKAKKPDISSTEAHVRVAGDRVNEAGSAVEGVGAGLDSATVSASEIAAAAKRAFEKGIAAGSAEAKALRDSVSSLQRELKAATVAKQKAVDKLGEASTALVETEKVNAQLRSDIEQVVVNNDELSRRLMEANVQIKKAEKTFADAERFKAERDEALKYKRGVWIVIAIIVAYFVIKLIMTLKGWTPQGRILKSIF